MVDKIEVAWTVAVAAIVAWVFVISLDTLQAIEEPEQGTTELKVTASRFLWTFEYPDGNVTRLGQGFADSDPLYLAKGEPVHMTLTSIDVIHSFFIPEIGIKIDAVPGRENERSFTPTVAGEFLGRCYEFCGVGHHVMTFPVTVFEPGAEGRPSDQLYGAPPRAEVPVEEDQDQGNDTDNQSGEAEVHEISLEDLRIVPRTLKVDVGARVALKVTNNGDLPHDLQIDDHGKTPILSDNGDTAWLNFTADQEGKFDWRCTVHPQQMTGSLTVGEGGGGEDGGTPGFDLAVGALAVVVGVALFAATRRKAQK